MDPEKPTTDNNCLRKTEQLCALGGLSLAHAAHQVRNTIDFKRGDHRQFNILVERAGSLIGREGCAAELLD